MFARLSVYDIPSDRREEADAGFREAIGRIRESQGFVDAFFLFGVESDRAAAFTIWESFDSMAASRVAASMLRGEAARSAGGEVVSVEEFEIVSRTSAAVSSPDAPV